MVGVIEGRITDVYWNDKYILATRCEVFSDSIVGYYIIEILPPVKKGVPRKVTGPYIKEEREKEMQKLLLDEKKMNHYNYFD